MDAVTKLLVVEDDLLIAANLAMQVTKLGYEVIGIASRGEEAIRHVADHKPTLVLLDINLKGRLDGIETATILQQTTGVPIIYVTANADEATFNRAKATHPYGFIAKPIRALELQRTLALTVSLINNNKKRPVGGSLANTPTGCSLVLSDRIFVRHKEKMVKIFIADILYIEADRNYCHLFTQNREYVLATTLKLMEEKLPVTLFARIHRSFMVNMTQIDDVAEGHVGVAGRNVPLSHLLREGLLKRMQTI